MIECPNCKNLNDEENQFCGKCGEKLPNPKFCPQCHYSSYTNDFCIKCGMKLVPKEECERISKKISNLRNQAKDFEDNNELENSLKCWDEISDLNIPIQHEIALMEKRKIYWKLGKFEEAIGCCDKLIEMDSNNNYAYLFKGDYLREVGSFEEAIECYDKSILINSDYHSPFIGKGRSLLAINKLDEALKCFNKALKIKDGSFYWSYIVGILIEFSQFEHALVYCNTGLNLHPDDIGLNFDKAKLLLLKGDVIESNELISKFGLRKSTLFYEVAFVFNVIGEFHKALRYCSKSLNFDSEDIDSLVLMGCIYFNLKQYELSLNYVKKGFKLSSDKERFLNYFNGDCRKFIMSNLFSDDKSK